MAYFNAENTVELIQSRTTTELKSELNSMIWKIIMTY